LFLSLSDRQIFKDILDADETSSPDDENEESAQPTMVERMKMQAKAAAEARAKAAAKGRAAAGGGGTNGNALANVTNGSSGGVGKERDDLSAAHSN
jgi:hypothetical protein